MDYIPSILFNFDQTDHDLLQLTSHITTPCQPYTVQQDNLLLNPFEDCSDLNKKSAHTRQRKASNSFAVNDDNLTDTVKRKIMHSEIERQRRQEMTSLYRTLRSLLPLKYLKGKRSISDHIDEAVNYIKDLRNKIQDLNEKRAELRRLSDLSTSSSGSESSQSYHHPEDSTVTVRPCLVGLEVSVSTSFRKGLPLSRVLDVLNGEGLSIVNCTSTKLNERMLHNIEYEVTHGRSLDLCELQQKITKLTSLSLN